jgi:hypothetical protein
MGDPKEILPQAPSRWYLTGFLVPTEADEEHRTDPTSSDELDQAAEPGGLDDDETPEKPAARRSFLPSSMGLSVLVSAETKELEATVHYASICGQRRNPATQARPNGGGFPVSRTCC